MFGADLRLLGMQRLESVTHDKNLSWISTCWFLTSMSLPRRVGKGVATIHSSRNQTVASYHFAEFLHRLIVL